ncbi:type IV secretion system DNA-binding domain-containing protein [Methylobacterium sp. J-030]|uniref:type IV secretory system conjugative DNA transfer family protein n=1 Tax=Methylobacterium sp. J-030 TaxID=2836627 RepID=UPI001FBB513A|nr:type IV secretion system DNA-binding domain-containing protein [Methylobacterium sp. J-030]MCJ2067389.1 type IV secretion system DNA-binding domain-containing protein [Methylobacterium sp. J-030]
MSIITSVAQGLPGFLGRTFRGARDPILSGDRRSAAEMTWPERQWPTLYKDIPADIRRPVVWDGRLLGGASVTWLAWHHFTPAVLTAAVESGGRAAKRTALIVFAILTAAIVYRLWQWQGGTQYPFWAKEVGAWSPIVAWYVLRVLETVFVGASGLLMCLCLALLFFPAAWFFASWRALKVWWQEASEPLRTPTRDALLIFKAKADIRGSEYQAYARQVEDASGRLSNMPLLAVGTATGALRARGDMESPSAGQVVAFDGESIRQHVLCLGATGTGKTRKFIRPMVSRIMNADWGAGHRIGAYITDGKGTLWRDVLPSVEHRDDVAVIGTGPGQVGVDLLAGMSPLEVATTFKAVSGQVAGKPADDFWPESASGLIMHAAAIAYVLDQDEDTVATWGDLRPYSLLGLARLATDEQAQKAACERIDLLADAEPGDVSPALYNAVPQALESVLWLRGTWLPMATETRSGIVANVNVVLGKLSGARALADRFFRGSYEDIVDVEHALDGGVLMVAVGETEWGLAGKVVNVWLKTRLYVAARKRLVTDPEACRNTSCALIADEFQMLVTAGPDSDTSFWNIARETGVFLIAATQSIAALHQVLGADQTANIVNLLRSKIILKTEELSTIDYVRKLAGELPRAWEPEPRFFATQGARELAQPDRTPALPEARMSQAFFPTVPRLDTTSMRDAVSYDPRFLMRRTMQDQTQQISSMQAAAWRQEDKVKDTLVSGLTWRPKVESDELLLGSGFAFAIVQRAGGDRSDIIDLEAA